MSSQYHGGHIFDYEKWKRLVSPERQEREKPDIWLPSLIPENAHIFLEIGVGPGFYVEYVQERLEKGDVYIGIDISFEMLVLCKKRIHHTNLFLLQTDGHRLPFHDGSIPFILIPNVFHEIRDPHLFFTEIFRVLQAGGEVIGWDWSPDGTGEHGPSLDKRVTYDLVRQWFHNAGFHIIHSIDLPIPEHFTIRARKEELSNLERPGSRANDPS